MAGQKTGIKKLWIMMLLLILLISPALLYAQITVTIGTSPASGKVCVGSSAVTFTANAAGGTGAYTYNWQFGAGQGTSTDNPATNFYITPDSYTATVTVIDASGNTAQQTTNISVFNLPNADFSASAKDSACKGQTSLQFTDLSTSSDGAITSWFWDFGDGGTSSNQNPSYIYPAATGSGKYDVFLQVTDANGCKKKLDVADYVTVHDLPTANFTYTSPACDPPADVTFTSSSTPVAGSTITAYAWSFGDAQTGSGSPATNTYAITGNYSVKLTVTDNFGCTDDVTNSVLVNKVTANFSFLQTDSCPGAVINFTNLSTAAFFTPTLSWSFPGGTPATSTVANPAVAYNTPGSYDVQLTTTVGGAGGCSDTITRGTIKIHPNPSVEFTVDTTYACSVPFKVTYEDKTPQAVEWLWDINYNTGIDYTVDSFSHTFTIPGNYNARLIVTDTNGCTSAATMADLYDDSVMIAIPKANFNADTFNTQHLFLNIYPGYPFVPPYQALGCAPLRVHFSDISTYLLTGKMIGKDSMVSWTWNFGDHPLSDTLFGGDSMIFAPPCVTNCHHRYPTHYYVDSGLFDVQMVATTALGCRDTITRDNLVGAGLKPIADFTVYDSIGCHAFTIDSFINLSSSFANGWQWDFGNGTSTEKTPPYTYQNDVGYFDVSLIAKHYECHSDTMVKDSLIRVLESLPAFTVTPGFRCFEDTLPTGGWQFTFTSLSKGADTWYWKLNDPLSPTFESVKDSIFTDNDTIRFPGDTNTYPLISKSFTIDTCNYTVGFPPDTVIADTATIPPPNPIDTLVIKADYKHYYVISRDTVLGIDTVTSVMPTDTVLVVDTTIYRFNYTIVPEIDTIIDTLYIIYMPPRTVLDSNTFYTALFPITEVPVETTILGCNTEFITYIDSNTVYNTIITPYASDTLYYCQPNCLTYLYDSVTIDTSARYVKPGDVLLYASADTISFLADTMVIIGSTVYVHKSAAGSYNIGDTIVIFPDTVITGAVYNINIDSIIIDTIVYNYSDTNLIGLDTLKYTLDTIPGSVTTTPSSTVFSGYCSDPIVIPEINTYSDTIYQRRDTVILDIYTNTSALKDTIIKNLSVYFDRDTINPIPFTHTYKTTGNKTVRLYAINSLNQCVDSTDVTLQISRITPGFIVNAKESDGDIYIPDPFQPPIDTLGCEDLWVEFTDTSFSEYGCSIRWEFGDDSTITTTCGNNAGIAGADLHGGLTKGIYSQPSHFYKNPGTYTVKLVVNDQFGCEDSASHQVVVKKRPAPKIFADTLTGCALDIFESNLTLVLKDTSTHSARITKWIWLSGKSPAVNDTNRIPQSDTIVYNTIGTFKPFIRTIDEFGCKSSDVPNVDNQLTIVTTNPVPSFTFTQPDLCSGTLVTFNSTSTGTDSLFYYWDWCDDTIPAVDTTGATSYQHIFDPKKDTAFRVTLTVEDKNGCRDTTSKMIEIHQPVGGFTVNKTISDCPEHNAQFTDTTITDNGIVSWLWDFETSNPSTQPNPSNIFPKAGNYDVIFIVTDSFGCKDTVIKYDYIKVGGPDSIRYEVIDTATCPPYGVKINVVCWNTEKVIFFWGDGSKPDTLTASISWNPDSSYFSATHYYMNGGGSVGFQPVIILNDTLGLPPDSVCDKPQIIPPKINVPGPVIDFFTNDTVCGPRPVTFTNTSTGTSDVDLWEWSFGDGYSIIGTADIPAGANDNLTSGTFNTPTHYYGINGSYDVVLTGYVINEGTGSQCIYADTVKKYVTVFTFPVTPIVGCPPLDFTFTADTNLIPLSTDSMSWRITKAGDTTIVFSATGDSIVASFPPSGVVRDSVNITYYDIYADFANGCSYRYDSVIHLYPEPNARFEIISAVSGVSIAINLENQSTQNPSVDSIYLWDFDDSYKATTYPSSPNTSHAYTDSLTYYINLLTINKYGCRDSLTKPKHIILKIPNVMSPGSKTAENSVFYIGDFFKDQNFSNQDPLHLIVFDRWGKKVYENEHYEECDPFTAPKKCWDGSDMTGKPLNPDTYYYILNLKQQSAVNGWVMIVNPVK